MGRVWLRLTGAVLLTLGLWALLAPAAMLGSIGLGMTGPGAEVEVRAMYGGLQLGLAVPVLRGARARDHEGPALLLAGCLLGGLGVARAVAAVAAGGPPVMFALCAVELVGGAGGLWLWRRSGG